MSRDDQAVYLVFIDDAKQSPSRPGIKGRLVGVGAIAVQADRSRELERSLAAVCESYGFPAGEEFKWSPRRDSWMFSNLVGEGRERFWAEVCDRLIDADCFATVVLEDEGRSPASSALSAEEDVVVLILERVANRLSELRESGLVVADRPGGGRREEDQFVADCLKMLEAGTAYVDHNEIAFILAADSKFVRLLQASDLVASCLTAYVAGESRYSPPVVERLLPLFPTAYDRRAGYSIKIHPSYNFANLHHWLFGESHWVRFQTGTPMPMERYDYFHGPDAP